jgi:predicted permease
MNRLWSALRPRRLDRDLDDEIAAHLAMQEEEFRRAGMGAREARDAARREFGGIAHTKEVYRDRRGMPWLESAAKDFRLALRGLRQNKGFAAAAVLSLALGIGANTAIFTIFRALMLRTLPVSRPDELVTLYRTGGWGRGYSSYPLYLEVKKRTDLFQDAIARSGVDKARFRAGPSERVETVLREHVTGNYFGVLGVAPAIGRLIAEPDDRTQHAHPVAVLSYDFWQSRFAGDPSVLGQTIILTEQPLTIVGVAQRGFRGVELDRRPDVWLPVMMRRGDIMEPGSNWAWMMARRRPEVSREQVQAAVDVLFRQYLAGLYGENTPARFRKVALAQQIEVREGAVGLSGLRENFGTALRVLMAAVGLVLLAACANVANLLLARGAARRKEVALRVSLGATRGRLIQQALMESFLLAALGAIAGITLAYWGTGAILAFLPEPFAVAPDGTVLAFTVALSGVAAILFGLGPAIRSAGIDPAAALRMTAGSRDARPTMRRVLVTVQVAFSVVLVALAGLFGHSMVELRSVDLGFRHQNSMAFAIDSPPAMDEAQRNARRNRLLEGLERVPGVTSVSYAFPGPYLGGSSNATVQIPGVETGAREGSWTSVHAVGPRYFETIGATVAAGRGVDRTDTAKARPVAVVNEAFVRQYLPGDARVLDRSLISGTPEAKAIVGVVRDIAHDGLRSKPVPTVYIPAAQQKSDWEPTIVARASLTPEVLTAAIRREFASAGLQFAMEPKPIRQRIEESVFQDRLLATLGGFFGILALALAAVGLYGVVAYGTARRAREIGIRIALGARRGEVVWMVLRDALVMVAAGLVLGLPASYLAAKQVAALLFGVKPLDPATFAITAAVLGAIGVGAALLPARRAATLEPLSVLRQD